MNAQDRLLGLLAPFGLSSPPATIQAVVRDCGNDLFAVKMLAPHGGIHYAFLQLRDGVIGGGGVVGSGAKAPSLFSVSQVVQRYPMP